MPRRTVAAVCLAAASLCAGLLPGLPGPVAASSCSGWTSESDPPPAIRVFRHVSGAVDVVNFKVYAKNVLSREWISSWTTASLRAGAQAVRSYAWYQVLHWRGGVNADGDCFDVRDDTWDQVYDPSKPIYATAAQAVDDTWAWRVYKSGHIFPTYYNAGSVNEACGANANGWKAYQWGTQSCGLNGLTGSQILLTYYYPDVTVIGEQAPTPTPTPSATPTPTPTPHPTPSTTPLPTSSGSASATPTPSPTPSATPTAHPTPSPTPRPTPTPTPAPSDQQLPGGGQQGLAGASAPPPPPPPRPQPIVARPSQPSPTIDAGVERRRVSISGPLQWVDRWPEPAAPPGPTAVSGTVATSSELNELDAGLGLAGGDPRLTTFRTLFPQLADEIVDALARQLADTGALAALLR
jgi:Stage II sporulation protein